MLSTEISVRPSLPHFLPITHLGRLSEARIMSSDHEVRMAHDENSYSNQARQKLLNVWRGFISGRENKKGRIVL